MTNYNDGNWHGWAKREKPPLHDLTRIERVYINGAGQLMNDSSSGFDTSVGSAIWLSHDMPSSLVLAFRVTKEHKEPREFWLLELDNTTIALESDVGDCIHVREVID